MMKKKTLWMLTLAIATCGMMALACGCGGCGDDGEGGASTSAPNVDQPTYSDEIKETPTSFDVTVTEGEGYKIFAASSVAANGSLEFTVEFDGQYNAEAATVEANGVPVACVDEKYVLANVNEHVTLSVKNLVRVSYGVLLASTDGVILTGDGSVKIGESYTFTVTLEEGATKGEDFAVKVNGERVTSATERYTVESVNKDLIITVSGVNVPYYAVSGLEGTGYVVSASSEKVMQGKDLSFAVNVDEAYERSEEYSVTVNGSKIEATNGVYTVKNVQSDVVIAVNGLSARQKFTVTYENCDLAAGTVYVGTLFHLPTPARPEYLFNGWKDENGDDFVMDYSGDVTVYASWITGGGVDYVARYQELAEDMEARYEKLKSERRLHYLNVNDYQMTTEYAEMYAHFTEHEKSLYGGENESVKAFLAEAEYIPHVELEKMPAGVTVTYDVDGTETSYSSYHGSTVINSEDSEKEIQYAFNGGFFSLQAPNADEPSLTYYFTLNKMNFKEKCEEYGRVSFLMKGNYAGMSLLCGDTPLAYTMAQHVLQRVDIQDGYLYVNGTCALQLSDEIYTGEKSLVFTVIRQESKKVTVNGVAQYEGPYFAQWDISHVYGAKRMEEYTTNVGENASVLSVKENIFSNNNAVEASEPSFEIATNGATKAYTYAYAGWGNLALDNVVLGEYECVKFFVKATGNVNVWGANGADLTIYFDKLANWTEIKLLKNGSGYDLYVNGVKNTRISNITNLSELAFNGDKGGTMTYTDLIAEK